MSNRGRNLPQLMVTIYAHQYARLVRQSRQSGLSLSRLVREKLQYADTRGYSPGSVSISDLRDEAHAAIREE